MSESAPTTKSLVNPYQMQWYLELYIDNNWTDPERVTEINSVDDTAEDSEYETSYLDRKKQIKYVMSTKETVEFELDAVGPGGIQAKLVGIEDAVNVHGRVTRTLAYDFEKGEAAPATALIAKQAECVVNVSPLKQESPDDPIHLTFNVSLSEEWNKGTFDESSKNFTPAG